MTAQIVKSRLTFNSVTKVSSRFIMLRFGSLFLLLLLILFGIGMTNTVYDAVVLPFTSAIASLSATILTSFDADVSAISNVLKSNRSGFSVTIESGCNGVEATLILCAAVLAFPAKKMQKLIAIIGGFITIQIFNMLRIISLFYLGQWNMDVFELAHLYLWPSLIVVDVLVVFFVWLRLISKPESEQQPA